MRSFVALLMGGTLTFGCGAQSDEGEPVSLKTCVNNVECCFSDDDCVEDEFCQGTGACDSEGTCEPILRFPCPLLVDLETGELAEPVCGCDGVTYQGACQATSSGHRISHDGRCEMTCSSNEDCGEGEYCHGDGPCDSPGYCRLIPPIDCGPPLNPDGTRDETAEVCGCDGVTYYSGCAAVTGGVRIAFEGGCP